MLAITFVRRAYDYKLILFIYFKTLVIHFKLQAFIQFLDAYKDNIKQSAKQMW